MKKNKKIDDEIEEMTSVAEDEGLVQPCQKHIHQKKIPNRRYQIWGNKIGSNVKQTWASVSTGETCAVNQFVKAVPGFQIWGNFLECEVDPEKYKDTPVYLIEETTIS